MTSDDPVYPELDGVVLSGDVLSFTDARILTVVGSELRECSLEMPGDAVIDAHDAIFRDMDLTGRRFEALKRVRFVSCRLGGADLGGAVLRDVTFTQCVLELASLRGAEARGVDIDGGRIDELDLSGARLHGVTFVDVDLSTVVLQGAHLEDVDLSQARLDGLTDLATIRGASISAAQAVALAPRLAWAAGIQIVDADG